MTGARDFYRRNLGIGVLLLVLLGATTASAYLPLGAWNTAVNLAIAAVKVGLVAACFMHLADSAGAVRIAAGIGVLMLLIFLALAATDYLARRPSQAPWQAPHSAPSFPSPARPS